jgi:hypothetical protein
MDVSNNPEEVKKFVRHLKDFIENMKQNISKIDPQFNHLGDYWKDNKHASFTQKYQSNTIMIKRFLKATEDYIPFLIKDAEKLQDYINHKY